MLLDIPYIYKLRQKAEADELRSLEIISIASAKLCARARAQRREQQSAFNACRMYERQVFRIRNFT